MERCDEDFEARIRALERLPGGEGRGGETGFHHQRSRAGGVVGGVIFKILDTTARYPGIPLPRRSLPYLAVWAIQHTKRVSKDISQSILHTYLEES